MNKCGSFCQYLPSSKLLKKNKNKVGKIPEKWDGKASERIVDTFLIQVI